MSTVGELRSKALAGDESDFRKSLLSAIETGGLGWLDAIRHGELLLAGRTAEARSAIRRAYIEALLEARAQQRLLLDEAVYASYCEVIADLRDQLAADARTHAAALHGFALQDAIELCARIVASSVRVFISRAVRARNTDTDRSALRDAALFSDISHEIGGRESLLAHMIKEVWSASVSRDGVPTSQTCALTATKGLFGIAEEWQTLSYARQRIAFGELKVERVELVSNRARVYLVPTNAVESWMRPAIERRLAGLHRQKRLAAITLSTFPVNISQLVELAAQLLPEPGVTPEVAAQVVEELRVDLGSTIEAVDVLLVARAPQDIVHFTLTLWSAYLLVSAINLLAVAVLKDDTTYGRRWPFTLVLNSDMIRDVLAKSARVQKGVATDALAAVTSDLGAKTAVDLGTRPFIRINDRELAFVRSPFSQARLFMETRRVLASRNATSRFLGAAYEEYIRGLLALGNFWVATGRSVLRDGGRQITDLDVVAYKDGIVFILQSKCIPEPDSVHASWKARDQIESGVRVAAQAG